MKQWDHLLRILEAGIRGVREATTPADGVRVMIHIDCGGDWPVTQWYFDHLTDHKIDYDIIGQSYYPYWHGTLAERARKSASRRPIDITKTS